MKIQSKFKEYEVVMESSTDFLKNLTAMNNTERICKYSR